jgi:hypothetical protein
MWILIAFIIGLLCISFISKSFTSRPFWISVLLGWLLFFMLLVFYNPQHMQAILNISSARVAYDVNWASTVVNHDFVTIVASDVEHLQEFMRTTTGGVRPVGSMHSFSPVVSTLGCAYVIDIRQLHEVVFLNSSHIRVGAGATIESVQKHLAVHNKTLRGIGSYTGQTLAGGFSTSLAGTEMVSFSSFATWGKTINGLGETIEWNDLYFLRDSMGMMGIIVELEFAVFDNYYLRPTLREVSLDDLISVGFSENIDAFDSITSFYADHQRIKTVSYTKNSEPGVAVLDIGAKTDANELSLIDYFVSPVSFIVPFYIFLPMMDGIRVHEDEQLATMTLDTHLFGLVFLDYRIPRSNCTAFFKRILRDPQDGIVRIKVLESRDDTCLAYTGDTCKIELYVPAHKHIKTYEHLAWEYGGYCHWGKYFRGNISEQLEQFSCWPEFERLRKIQDPDDRFLNSYLKGNDYQYWHGGDRLWVFYICLVYLVVVAPMWFLCQCVQGMRHRKNKDIGTGYVRLQPPKTVSLFTNVRILW